MTNTTATIFSTYQAKPTAYAVARAAEWVAAEAAHTDNDITSVKPAWLVANEINCALHRQAEAIAPRFADETAESGCTNARPGDDAPRRQAAWDMIAEALTWNMICDYHLEAEATVVLRALAAGEEVTLTWSHDFTSSLTAVKVETRILLTPEPTAAEDTPARISDRSHTDADGNTTEVYRADDLRPGDIIRHYGMTMVVTTHWTPSYVTDAEDRRVWVNHCVILNEAEVLAAEFVGGLMYDRRLDYGHQAHWNCQGNHLASFLVHTAGPLHDAAVTTYNDLRPSLHTGHFTIPPQARQTDAQSLLLHAPLPTTDTPAAKLTDLPVQQGTVEGLRAYMRG